MNEAKIEQKIPLRSVVRGTRNNWKVEGKVVNYRPWDGVYSIERLDGSSWTDAAEYLELVK